MTPADIMPVGAAALLDAAANSHAIDEAEAGAAEAGAAPVAEVVM